MGELSRTFKLVTVWLLIGLATFVGVQLFEAQRVRARFEAAGGVIELRRAPDGHFHWPGSIGGVAVEFLVDTGATTTAVPLELAERAGLVLGSPLLSGTAGGIVHGHEARADILLEGGVRAERLRVAVLPALERPLLGMDLLSKMAFSQRANVLRFEPARR